MTEELRFFLISTGITLVIFSITTMIEVFVLRAFKRLEAPKNLYYALSANISGFIVTIIIASIMVFMFLALFATAMGGAGTLALGSFIGIIILILLIPILMFILRFFLFRFFGIDDTKFRVIYSLLTTIGVLAAMIVMWSVLMVVLSYVAPNV